MIKATVVTRASVARWLTRGAPEGLRPGRPDRRRRQAVARPAALTNPPWPPLTRTAMASRPRGRHWRDRARRPAPVCARAA